MLKSSEVYLVTVALNDGHALTGVLLSKPDAATLTAVAAAQNAKSDFGKVLALADEIVIPAVNENANTAIRIGDVTLGTVSVETRSAYGLPVKRGPKPKTTVSTDTPDANKPKRGRKNRASAGTTVAAPEVAAPESV
jgi:hypothetical protein